VCYAREGPGCVRDGVCLREANQRRAYLTLEKGLVASEAGFVSEASRRRAWFTLEKSVVELETSLCHRSQSKKGVVYIREERGCVRRCLVWSQSKKGVFCVREGRDCKYTHTYLYKYTYIYIYIYMRTTTTSRTASKLRVTRMEKQQAAK